jgi:aminomethyltransferase
MSSITSLSTGAEVAEEHRVLRHDRGLIEWRGAGVFDVAGTDAAGFLDEVCTRSVAFLFEERTLAALLLADDGSVLAIVDLLCRGDSYTVLVWPDQRLVAWTRLAVKAEGRDGVTLSDRSDSTTVLAVEGPRAGAAVEPFLDGSIGQIAYRSFTTGRWEEAEMVVARIGVTAEFGYTLLVPLQHGDSVRARLVEMGVRPCGREAVDVCRMESRFVNLERECPHPQTTPFELGLQWMIDFTHGFAARRALLERWEAEVMRLPVCFTAPQEAGVVPGDGCCLLTRWSAASPMRSGRRAWDASSASPTSTATSPFLACLCPLAVQAAPPRSPPAPAPSWCPPASPACAGRPPTSWRASVPSRSRSPASA